MSIQLSSYNQRKSCDLNVFKVDRPQFSEIEKTMSRWAGEAKEKMELIGKIAQKDYECMEDCQLACLALSDTSDLSPASELYLCRDTQEKDQAIMLISINRFINIIEITSNPWNIVPRVNKESDSPVRGAATALIVQAIKRAIELEKECTLYSLISAVPFYETLGFKQISNEKKASSYTMRLTAEKIRDQYSHLFLTAI